MLAWAQNALCYGRGAIGQLTLEQGHGAGTAQHGTAGTAPSADGHRACYSWSYFVFNSASQRDGERKRWVLPWLEVQIALFSHYEHCAAIMDNYNLTSQFIFLKTARRHWSQRLLGDNSGDACCSSWLCILSYGDSRVSLRKCQILKPHYTSVYKTDLNHSPPSTITLAGKFWKN